MLLNGIVEDVTIHLVRGKELQLLNKKLAQQKLKEDLCNIKEESTLPEGISELPKKYSIVFEVPK